MTSLSPGDVAPLLGQHYRDRLFEDRVEEATRIRNRYPDRLPCIVERATNRGASNVPLLDKVKFLVPSDLTVGQLAYVLRRRLTLASDVALFLYVGNTLPSSTMLMREVYAAYRDADGFLYLTYSGESAFGSC